MEAHEKINQATDRLMSWIEAERFQGYETHDALNSPLLNRLSFGYRPLQIAFVQALRRSPVNLRSLLGIRKDYNPKGLGLFLMAYLNQFKRTAKKKYLEVAQFLINWLEKASITGYSGCCWGYHFDWPNRAFFAPKGTPTIVNSSFIAQAFLEAFDVLKDSRLLNIARSTCDFFLNDLNIFADKEDEICFSYTPLDRRLVHNANMLGASLLARVYHHTQEDELLVAANRAVSFTVKRQNADGSWPYGVGRNESWVDNFHMGFVLVWLKEFMHYAGFPQYQPQLLAGYNFYKRVLFLSDGRPKYHPDSLYPIDIHCIAQAILTFLRFKDVDSEAHELAIKTALWAIDHMQDARGFFHYQIHRFYRIKIPYMRWSQAWMLLALTQLLSEL